MATRLATARPISLAAIKCSTCGDDIPLLELATHVCSAPPPKPVVQKATTWRERLLGFKPAVQSTSDSPLDPAVQAGEKDESPAPGNLRAARTLPPHIDAEAANRPFLGRANPFSPDSNYSSYSYQQSSRPATPSTQLTSPSSLVSRKPYQSHSRNGSPPSAGIQHLSSPQPSTAESASESGYGPSSPKPQGGATFLSRFNDISAGPFGKFGGTKPTQSNGHSRTLSKAEDLKNTTIRNAQGREHFRKPSGNSNKSHLFSTREEPPPLQRRPTRANLDDLDKLLAEGSFAEGPEITSPSRSPISNPRNPPKNFEDPAIIPAIAGAKETRKLYEPPKEPTLRREQSRLDRRLQDAPPIPGSATTTSSAQPSTISRKPVPTSGSPFKARKDVLPKSPMRDRSNSTSTSRSLSTRSGSTRSGNSRGRSNTSTSGTSDASSRRRRSPSNRSRSRSRSRERERSRSVRAGGFFTMDSAIDPAIQWGQVPPTHSRNNSNTSNGSNGGGNVFPMGGIAGIHGMFPQMGWMGPGMGLGMMAFNSQPGQEGLQTQFRQMGIGMQPQPMPPTSVPYQQFQQPTAPSPPRSEPNLPRETPNPKSQWRGGFSAPPGSSFTLPTTAPQLGSHTSRCSTCSLPITGKSVKDSSGRLPGRHHRSCFVCRTCKAPFPTGEFYVLADAPYCGPHYHTLNGSQCQSCGIGIEGAYAETDEGTKWHRMCFACEEPKCGRPLGEEYFERDGMRYCEKHAYGLVGRGKKGGTVNKRKSRVGMMNMF